MTEQTPPPATPDPAHAAQQAAQQQAYAQQQQQQAAYQSQPGYTGQYQQYQAPAPAGPNVFDKLGVSVAAVACGASALLLVFVAQLLGTAGDTHSFSVDVSPLGGIVPLFVLVGLVLFTDVVPTVLRVAALVYGVLTVGGSFATLIGTDSPDSIFLVAVLLYAVGAGLATATALLPKHDATKRATQAQPQQGWQQHQ